MNNYYLLNSTIFSKGEEVVAALKEGKVVYNDDARLKFKMENFTRKKGEPRRENKLMACGIFEDEWVTTIVDWKNVDSVISAMDLMVDYDTYPKWLEWHKGENFKNALEGVFNDCGY